MPPGRLPEERTFSLAETAGHHLEHPHRDPGFGGDDLAEVLAARVRKVEGPAATTLAVRGWPSRIDISPKKSPRRRRASVRPFRTTVALPSRTTKNTAPPAPSLTTVSPSS